KDSNQLLEAVAKPADRKKLAAELGVATSVVLDLANRADLARVNGIGTVFADLLEKAGVDTVKELATRNPDNLLAKMTEVNSSDQVSKRLPQLADVQNWIAQAKELPKLLQY
ncbi:MAG: DUF4332 domain-containing protein, partial [Candidatus Competibacteraceae bacterium]|nr:DUF4332 domain-containing protein [Candidatus Competibacteraceae bacterium]